MQLVSLSHAKDGFMDDTCLDWICLALSSGYDVRGAIGWHCAEELIASLWADVRTCCYLSCRKVDGAEAGIIFASEPVWATLFASTVLGESFGFKEPCI
eukprot:6256139-Amphidinium_carterae.1